MSETPAKAATEAARGIPASLPYRFGDYELEAEIARGAMGVVFRARQISLGRTVALKLVLASWLATDEQRQRFLTEARASAGLNHPSIVPVHEIGEHAGQHFICLAFVQGQSLAARIEAGSLAPRKAAMLLREIAGAIQYAHDQGILHRDIKPGNILLDEEGHAWITDFGLAKLEGDSTRVTATGMTVGTPSYMSPEQAAGEVIGVGPATDVYGLGATLYACLTGRPPFLGPSAIATMRLVQERDPIPLGTLNPIVPRDLQTICMSCLAKSPRHRYASAGLLANDLQRFLDDESIQARPVSLLERLARRLKRHPRTAGLLIALCVILCTSAITVVTQWQRALDALEAQDFAEARRIESMVEALGLAAPEAFRALAEQLDLDDPRVLERLQLISTDEEIDERLRFRSRLAMLPRHPRAAVELAREVGRRVDDPREFRLAVESIRAALPDLDRDTHDAILQVFAEDSTNPTGGEAKRFRCALALYACAPEHPAWRAQVESVARILTQTSPFQLPTYAALLTPWPRELLAELGELFVDGDERERQASAELLARAAKAFPEELARLLPRADNSQHRILREALRDESKLIADSMREYLARPRPRSRAEVRDLSPIPDVEAVQVSFRASHGILHPGFAHCVDMPLEEFKSACEALRPFAYTPVKVRPFRNGDEVSVSAILVRDGREWEIDWDAQDLPESGSVAPNERPWIPIDLASYVAPGRGAVDAEHDLVVWSEPLDRTNAWILKSAQTAKELYESSSDLIAREYRPISLQISINASGIFLVDTLWHQVEASSAPEIVTGLTESQLAIFQSTELSQIEIDVTARDAEYQVCSGIWTPDQAFESRVIWEKSPADHQQAALALTELGFTPVATSASWNDSISRGSIVSTWQRPWIRAEERIIEDRCRARAAATLAGEGHLEEVLPLLRKSHDPSVRFQLALEFANLELTPSRILEELESRTATDERFALLLALGRMPLRQFDGEQRSRWMTTLRHLAVSDPDAGIHSLSRWILRKLEVDTRLESVESEEPRNWSFQPEEHTMVRIEAPAQFVMGAAGWVRGRRASEAPHLHLVEHPFEIASSEVTVAQIRRFHEAEPSWGRANRQRDPSEASEFTTWFEAVAYCRWLSETAGLPEEEMCYPPLSEIGPEMILEANHLERTGYRLPSEAEWEYACRAGARTLYFFGSDTKLLADFANLRGPHDSGDAERRVRPVAQGFPNDFGLFDMHGNVQEWCHDAFVDHMMLGRLAARVTDDSRMSLDDQPHRNLRGGWYDSSPLTSGCASRRRARADTRSRGIGFRIARTVR